VIERQEFDTTLYEWDNTEGIPDICYSEYFHYDGSSCTEKTKYLYADTAGSVPMDLSDYSDAPNSSGGTILLWLYLDSSSGNILQFENEF
jgi:hypothetical protein